MKTSREIVNPSLVGASLPSRPSRLAGGHRPVLRRSERWRSALARLCLLASCLSFLGDPSAAQGEDIQRDADGNPVVISMEAVESILEVARSKNLEDVPAAYPPSFVAKVGRAIDHYLYSFQVHVEDGLVTKEGCMLSSPTESEDLFAVRAPGRATSLDQLVANADQASVVEISSVETMLVVEGLILTAVEVAIVDHWSVFGSSPRPGEAMRFFRPEFDVTVAGDRLCAGKDGIRLPREGELWLLLSAAGPDDRGVIFVANLFPIEEGLVQRQGYPFLNDDFDGNLGRLKALFLGAKGR